MITVTNLSLAFSGSNLFKDVNLKFVPGNCYGIIGANGAGKSTFLRILSGELEPSTGEVIIPENTRMSVLKQDHFAFNEYTVLDTIIMGNRRLYDVMKEKDALYMKENFSDEDGERASELEGEFAEMGGWDAKTDAVKLLRGLGLDNLDEHTVMSSVPDAAKVKILLAQALFGQPEILLLDEPTNHLDIKSIAWLEEFLMDYPGTVLVVSHDRHFLNNVCTHICDIDYNSIKIFVGNYDFWYESSQLIQRLLADQHRKASEKIAELQNFVSRFSANKSKAKQATARRKLIEKLSVEELPCSTRRYPFVGFTMDREPGKEILRVNGISKTIDGVKILNNVSFALNKTDKVAFIAKNDLAMTTLFKILFEEIEPDEGTFNWGVSTTQSYLPRDNGEFFDGCDMNLVEWLSQWSKDQTQTYLRGFLGKMLFSGDEVLKPVKVLSGGEKVRCMLSRMMLFGSNVLVLDQPTNHLDLEAITAVNKGVESFKGVVLFASHDHEFMGTIANRIIEITEDGVIDRACTYDEYIEYMMNR